MPLGSGAELGFPRERRRSGRRSAEAESAKRHESVSDDGTAKGDGRDRFCPHAGVGGVGAGSGDSAAGVGEVVLP